MACYINRGQALCGNYVKEVQNSVEYLNIDPTFLLSYVTESSKVPLQNVPWESKSWCSFTYSNEKLNFFRRYSSPSPNAFVKSTLMMSMNYILVLNILLVFTTRLLLFKSSNQEAYSTPCQTSKKELFVKIVNGVKQNVPCKMFDRVLSEYDCNLFEEINCDFDTVLTFGKFNHASIKPWLKKFIFLVKKF